MERNHAADRERAAQEHLLASGATDLTARPWRPAPAPPSAVDLAQFALWRSNRHASVYSGDVESADVESADGGSVTGGPSGSDSTVANTGALLSALTLLPAARAEVEGLEAGLLFTARSAGLTWAQIADAMGFRSPQACQQHFMRLSGRVGER